MIWDLENRTNGRDGNRALSYQRNGVVTGVAQRDSRQSPPLRFHASISAARNPRKYSRPAAAPTRSDRNGRQPRICSGCFSSRRRFLKSFASRASFEYMASSFIALTVVLLSFGKRASVYLLLPYDERRDAIRTLRQEFSGGNSRGPGRWTGAPRHYQRRNAAMEGGATETRRRAGTARPTEDEVLPRGQEDEDPPPQTMEGRRNRPYTKPLTTRPKSSLL